VTHKYINVVGSLLVAFLIVPKMRHAEFRAKNTREIQFYQFRDREIACVTASKKYNSGSSDNI
jgi:hypothetical protein